MARHVQQPTVSVEVDREVFKAVQAEAEPLLDDFNSVLRRKLGLDAARGSAPGQSRLAPGSRARGRQRVAPGSILPEREYERPLLQALVEAGGGGPAGAVTDRVGDLLQDRLTETDRELHVSGDIRWRNRTAFTRLRLKERGLISADSPRGRWEITERGREELRRLDRAEVERGPRPKPRMGIARSSDGRSAAELTSEPVAHPLA